MSQIGDLRPLVIKYLVEWKNASSKTGSKMEFVYRNALKSIREVKEPICSMAELMKLKYFGEKTCKRIGDTLKAHFMELGIEFGDPSDHDDVESLVSASQSNKQKKQKKSSQTNCLESPKKKRNYTPKPYTGGFAILVALCEAEEESIYELPKDGIIERAQKYSSESMSVVNLGSHYTAWSSMKTLISHNFISIEKQRNSFYSLTEDGREKAKAFLEYVRKQRNDNMPVVSASSLTSSQDENQSDGGESQSSSASSRLTTRFTLAPNCFDIVILVDSREQTSNVDKAFRKTALITELLNNGLCAEMRALQAGDFLWIAREKVSASAFSQPIVFGSCKGKELVLDPIVERKRVDDLVGSIKDGRWHEQKYRLKNSGVRQPTYLIESMSRGGDYSLPFRNLNQAVVNAQVVDGFKVKMTKDYKETVTYLVTMTKYLTKLLSNKTLKACSKDELIKDETLSDDHFMTFAEFDRNAKKVTNFSVGEMFVKQLLTFRGVSLVKAMAITDQYKTFVDLIEAYQECQSKREGELLLANIKYGDMQRNIGPAVSKMIHLYYTYEPDS